MYSHVLHIQSSLSLWQVWYLASRACLLAVCVGTRLIRAPNSDPPNYVISTVSPHPHGRWTVRQSMKALRNAPQDCICCQVKSMAHNLSLLNHMISIVSYPKQRDELLGRIWNHWSPLLVTASKCLFVLSKSEDPPSQSLANLVTSTTFSFPSPPQGCELLGGVWKNWGLPLGNVSPCMLAARPVFRAPSPESPYHEIAVAFSSTGRWTD